MPQATVYRVRITKLDAARRQLRSAIKLFFEDGDPIVIHTLVAATHGILRDICLTLPDYTIHWESIQVSGSGSFLKDLPVIREDRRKEWNRKLNEAQNFFKHADRDPDKDTAIDFAPVQSQFLLFDAVLMYHRVATRHLREGLVYFSWYILENPDHFIEEGVRQHRQTMLNLGINAADKALCAELIRSTLRIPDTD